MTETPSTPATTSAFARWMRNLGPVLLGLVLFGMGVFALYRLLKPVDPHDVLAQVKAMPWPIFAKAVTATALGYVALIGYDWSALRYLGKQVPLRIVAIGGFLGYSFGNTVGVSVVSGGAVRYRIYSAFGLNAFEVAAVSTFVALAFGVGITVVGLGAMIAHPGALAPISPLPPGQIRLWASVVLAALLALMLWLSFTGKVLRFRRYEISAPRPGIVFGQLALTLIDTAMAALTLYILLPAGGPDYISVLALFSVALAAGVLSHVPGGVGVFETVFLAGMPPGVPLHQVAAALVLYRVIYYLLPFLISLAVVALNEARLAGGAAARLLGDVPEQLQPLFRSVLVSVPGLVALLAFGVGVYLILMSLIPSVRPDEIDPNDLLAAILLEGGTILSAALGTVLLILSQGLARRISGAFWLTEVALLSAVIASLLNHLDVESALLLLTAALILWPFRRDFYRSAKLTHAVLTPSWIALVVAILLAVTAFFFFMHAATPYSEGLWTGFSGAENTPRALRAGLLASALLVFFTLYLALQPAQAHRHAPDAEGLAAAALIVDAQEDPLAYLALTGDKALYLDNQAQAFIMYAAQGKSWVAYADPVGPASAIPALAWAFADEAYTANCRPVFYEVSDRYLPLWIEMGYSLHKIGEEAVVDLADFSLAGSKFKTMRAAHNKAQKEGLEFSVLAPPHAPEVIAELQEISQAWLGSKAGREKGFSVGRFDAAYLDRFSIGIVRREGRILAFANILWPADSRRVSIDLMRYRPEAASGMMEFLFIALMTHAREAGAACFSLGMAPLAGIEARRGARLWNRFGVLIFRHGGAFYNFAGLRAFKQKFQPRWEPRFIAIPGNLSPLVAMKDVALLIAGGAKGIIGK